MGHNARNPISEENAFNRMARLCAAREYSAYDIRQKLQRLNVEEVVVSAVLAKLENRKYIDNLRFAKSFVRDKVGLEKWGRNKIEYTLKQKRIPAEVISAAFAEISEEMLLENLKTLIAKKMKSVSGKSDYDKKGKVIRFCLSRGYSMADIIRLIERTKEGDYEF